VLVIVLCVYSRALVIVCDVWVWLRSKLRWQAVAALRMGMFLCLGSQALQECAVVACWFGSTACTCSRVSCICTRDPCHGSVSKFSGSSDYVMYQRQSLGDCRQRVMGLAVCRQNRWMPAHATTGAYWLAVLNPQLVIASFHDSILNTFACYVLFWRLAPCLGLFGPCAVAAAVSKLWAVLQ
jgi:hypothetical protein